MTVTYTRVPYVNIRLVYRFIDGTQYIIQKNGVSIDKIIIIRFYHFNRVKYQEFILIYSLINIRTKGTTCAGVDLSFIISA